MRKVAITEKARKAIGFGLAPAGALGIAGDLLAPAGWVIPLGLGVLALCAVVALMMFGTGAIEAAADGDSAMAGMWDGPRHRQWGVWALAIFAATGVGTGLLAKSKASDGGLLAGTFESGETSTDPRKAIASLGQPWSESGFADAVERDDMASVALYASGGMRVGKSTMGQIFAMNAWMLSSAAFSNGIEFEEAWRRAFKTPARGQCACPRRR